MDDTTDACIKYNIAGNKWEGGVAAMPAGVNHAAAATDGKLMYVAGGRDVRNTVGNGLNYLQVRPLLKCSWVGRLGLLQRFPNQPAGAQLVQRAWG